MPVLTHRVSYETLKFDTVDGDIHDGQFAIYQGMHIVRLHPENNRQFTILEGLDNNVDIAATINGLTEVHVVGKAYYDEFVLPGGRMFRVPSDSVSFFSFHGVKDGAIPSKALTLSQIVAATANDSNWLGKAAVLKNAGV